MTLLTSGDEALYNEVWAHYGLCRARQEYLSDTWVHTLKQKGNRFSRETMERMLELGNRVNTWIDDFNFLIDGTAIDAADPIVGKLLKLGEPEFGHPRRDCLVGGTWHSSNFVHHVLYAQRIIAAIEERGIVKPRILEIGGGLGGIAYLLKAYFGSRASYFVVDLPEGLPIQEWYLRSCFPEAPTAYKAGDQPCVFVDGGLNFINAFALESQDFPFDVAINIDSMQEMNSTAVAAYLRFFERNIDVNGLFYFQNQYGAASSPVSEPSEYPLDDRWTLRLAEVASQHECCTGAEQARLIYYRTAGRENPQTRRLVLRLLWNGFMSGRIANDPSLVKELVALPGGYAPEDAVVPMKAALATRALTVTDGEIAALKDSPYFARSSYENVLASGPGPKSLGRHEARMDALWRAQSGYLKALKNAGSEGDGESELKTAAAVLVEAGDVGDSEFYTAYYSSLLFVLGEKSRAEAMLVAYDGDNPFWLVRFATLLDRFGRQSAAEKIVLSLKKRTDLDFYVALKCAELSADRVFLRGLGSARVGDEARILSFAKTAARLGDGDTAFGAFIDLIARAPESAQASLLGILAADGGGVLRPRGSELLAKIVPASVDGEEPPIMRGLLLLALGRKDEALSLIRPLIDRFEADYFRLGQLGRFFQQAGLDDLSDRCLDRSVVLRPGAFLHFDFVGNAYFGAGRFDRAEAAYSQALAIKPYLRNLLAKKLYSALPKSKRDGGRFGKSADLRLVFQKEQDFYHDLGPASK